MLRRLSKNILLFIFYEKWKITLFFRKDYESSSSDSEDEIDPEQIQLLKEYISNKENTDVSSLMSTYIL